MPSPDKVSEIDVSADGGVSQEQLVENLQPVLPKGVEAITGDDLTKENNEDINNDFLGLLRGVPARVRGRRAARRDVQHLQHVLDHHRPAHARVGAAARDRRVARARCSASIALEALAIGFVASVLGLLAGIGLAVGLRALFDALGSASQRRAHGQAGTVVAAFAGRAWS